MKQTKEYYDTYSDWYEKRKEISYHLLIDELESDLVERYASGKTVLDAGCGNGVILNRVKAFAKDAFGVDLSLEMLKRARKSAHKLVQARIEELPIKKDAFDVVYSFKVLPHVPRIEKAIEEMSKVVNKKGYLILEFYNPHSLRHLIKLLKRPSKVSEDTSDTEVFTRYDSYARIKKIIPGYLRIEAVRGIRIFTPVSHVYEVPVISNIFRFLERFFCDSPLKFFAGFLIVVLAYRD
jgi:ubiquinone/menaquinone biosynthesis C-methylase UbiE